MSAEIWVLGATGRSGQAIASRLHAAGAPLVLAGRDRQRLERVAAKLGGDARVIAGSLDDVLGQIARQSPAVVVNTVGPFGTTAARVARACPPRTHYVDIANELTAAQAILDLDQLAIGGDRVLVTGGGFGVLATESVLLRVCDGEPPPTRVRVDAVPSVALEAGVLGAALAATIVQSLPAGGRQVRHGRLTSAPAAGHSARFNTPDGDVVTTANFPSGDLLAAWRATGAEFVVAASSEVPHGRAVRLALPTVGALMRIPAVARLATTTLARMPLKDRDRPRQHSWARASVQWASGASREGWLRADDAMEFTATAAAEIAQRLASGEGRPGAHTPGTLFGAELAVAAGAEMVRAGEILRATPSSG